MECPKCQSSNAQLCSVAHAQGTSTTKTSGTATGQSVGYSAGGGYGVAQHNLQTSSTSTTKSAFAERAAPPTNWYYVFVASSVACALFIVIVGFNLRSVLGFISHDIEGLAGPIWIGTLLWLAVSLFGLSRTYPERQKYAEAKRRWAASWICVACGNIFVPTTAGKAN
jgi:hypothetical protein